MKRSALGAGGSRTLAGYEILFELGQGGMGAAYLARAAGSDGFERLVVIKRPLPRHPADAETVSRFLREARIAAAIHHANVAGTHQVGEDEQGPFIVLDYIDGASFSDLDLRCALAGSSTPARIALRIVLDALAGLEAVHGATNVHGEPLHILHRDVSLGNILVGRDGVARLSDFGVAKSEPGKGHTNKQRYLVGKLPYVSPEYLRGGTIGPETDVYALSVTLWLALAGHDPWPEADDGQVMRHILEDGMPPLPAREDVSPKLAELVARACAREPERRFKSARELSDAIEELDRESPCIAKPREVASWVGQVLGAELDQRRKRIASVADLGNAAPEASQLSGARRNTPPTLSPHQLPLERQTRRLWTGVALLGAVAIVFIAWRSGSSSAPPVASTPAATSIEEPPAAPKRELAAPAIVTPVGPALPPSPAATAEASTAPAGAPSVSAAPSASAAPATPRKSGGGKSQPARSPDDIRRSNPYR